MFRADGLGLYERYEARWRAIHEFGGLRQWYFCCSCFM
jgi:hypothetical protein